MTQAELFWKETPLANVASLVATFRGYAAQEADLADLYNSDADDFHKAIVLFRQSDSEGLSQYVSEMDTSAREDLVEAFWFDCGNDFVENVLGFSMSKSWINSQREKSVAV
jgi:hypothetical protein